MSRVDNVAELRGFKKIFETKALVDFTRNGEKVAYGWEWKDLEPLIIEYTEYKLKDFKQRIIDADARYTNEHDRRLWNEFKQVVLGDE